MIELKLIISAHGLTVLSSEIKNSSDAAFSAKIKKNGKISGAIELASH